MKMKYLCLAIYLAWSGVAVAETVQQASAVSVVVAQQSPAAEQSSLSQDELLEHKKELIELKQDIVERNQKDVDWWLSFLSYTVGILSIALAVITIGLPVLYARYQKKFHQKIDAKFEDMKTKASELETLVQNGQTLFNSLQGIHQESQKYAAEIEKLHGVKFALPNENLSVEQIEQNQAGIEAAEKLVDNREIPLVEQLRAQAILLLDSAKTSQQYHDYEKAFHAWYAVWLQDENDASVCFYLGFTAQNLYEKSTNKQQLYWQPEIEKWYGKALQIKPYYHEAANNLGIVLDNEAQALRQENKLPEAYEKWQQAGQHYQQALQLKPDLHEAAYNWGVALFNEAQALQQENRLPEAYEKWQQAGQHYQQALQIKPNYYDAAHGWMACLSHMYQAIKAENPDMATQLLQQAKQIAHDFLAKYPQYAPEFAYNRACVFALENNLPKAIEQLKLAQQSDNFPDKAHILQDKDLANIRETPEFQAWLKEAFPDTE